MFVLKVYPLCSYSLSCSLSLSMHIVIWQLEKWKYRCRVICQRSDRIPVVKQRIIARFPWYQINEINSGLDILSQCKLFYIKKFSSNLFSELESLWHKSSKPFSTSSLPKIPYNNIYKRKYLYIYKSIHMYIYVHIHIYMFTGMHTNGR